MSSDNHHTEDQHPDESDYSYLTSLGKEFSNQRQERKISIEQAAVDLHIDKRFIEAIEDDDYAQIGKRVFIRGYVINYARYLGMEQGLVLEMLEPFLQKLDSQSEKLDFLDNDINNAEHLDYSKAQLNLNSGTSHSRRGRAFWIGLALMLLCIGGGVAAYVYFSSLEFENNVVEIPVQSLFDNPEEAARVTEGTRAEPLPQPVLRPPPDETDRTTDAGRSTTDLTTDAAHSTTDRTTDAARSTTDNTSENNNATAAQHEDTDQELLETAANHDQLPPQAPGIAEQRDDTTENATTLAGETEENPNALVSEGGDTLQFLLDENCWIEVRREDGSILVSRLFQAGDNPLLQLTLPVAVIIGNAAGASLRVNNSILDIGPHTNSNVARLNIPG